MLITPLLAANMKTLKWRGKKWQCLVVYVATDNLVEFNLRNEAWQDVWQHAVWGKQKNGRGGALLKCKGVAVECSAITFTISSTFLSIFRNVTQKHTHTHTQLYIYKYVA